MNARTFYVSQSFRFIELRAYIENNASLQVRDGWTNSIQEQADDIAVEMGRALGLNLDGSLEIRRKLTVSSNRAGLHLAYQMQAEPEKLPGIISPLVKAGWKQCKGS